MREGQDSSDLEWGSGHKSPDRAYHRWSHAENKMYANFLKDNFQEFKTNHQRRSLKFFKRMAEALKYGKNNLQCRSHHQKMVKKFGSVSKIIQANLGGNNAEIQDSEGSTEQLGAEFKVSTNSAWRFYRAV